MNRYQIFSLIVACASVAAAIGTATHLYDHTDAGPSSESIPLYSFAGSKETYEEMKDSYKRLVREVDPAAAIEKLKSDAEHSEHIAAVCHDLLHGIGEEAMHVYGSFDAVIGYHSDFCNSGFLHGMFESYFVVETDPLSTLSLLCKTSEFLPRTFDVWQCEHGLGHGLMYYTDGDQDEAFALCGMLEQTQKESCENGVWMELFNAEILPYERDAVLQDSLELCKNATIAKVDCYTYVPTQWSYQGQVPYGEMFDLCRMAEYGYDVICASGVGSEAMKRNMLSFDMVFALCANAPSGRYRDACVSGMASMYMNQRGSYEAGVELCKSAPAVLASACDARVAAKEAFFAPADL